MKDKKNLQIKNQSLSASSYFVLVLISGRFVEKRTLKLERFLRCFLGARVVPLNDLAKPIVVEVGINLSRRDIRVPEHGLYDSQISATR
jgi:hypothetical protein